MIQLNKNDKTSSVMNPIVPAISFFSLLSAITSVAAQDLASASPFRIDIETDHQDNYAYTYLSGSSSASLSLSQAGSTFYYLGVDPSTQFAAEVEGLSSRYHSFVRGTSEGDFGLVSSGFTAERVGEVYWGQLNGLQPVFHSASAYSLEDGKELISAFPTSFDGYSYRQSITEASLDIPTGFVVSQHSSGEQAVELFLWDAAQDAVVAATQMDAPSLNFDHSRSFFYPAFWSDDSGPNGFRFESTLASVDTRLFLAFFDTNLVLTSSFVVGPSASSGTSWNSGGFNDSENRIILNGNRYDNQNFENDAGYISIINSAGEVRWSRYYSHAEGSFDWISYSGEWEGKIFLRAAFGDWPETKEHLIVVDGETGAVLQALDMDIDEVGRLTFTNQVAPTGKFAFFGEDDFYGLAESNLTDGSIHRLSPEIDHAYDEVSLWYYGGDPSLSEVQFKAYDRAASTLRIWLAVENTCDVFDESALSFNSVSVNSVSTEPPNLTAVATNTSSPSVGLVSESRSLPTLREEPSRRIAECFGGEGGGGDIVGPTISSFSVSPTIISRGSKVTASYTITDTGGSGLDRVELWRTADLEGEPDPNWSVVNEETAMNGNGPVSGSLEDIPPAVGAWWYGIDVVDAAENRSYESDFGLGPIKVIVENENDPESWYAASSNLADGWRYFDWFKGFKPAGGQWIYHGRHGWLYVQAEDTSGIFLWDVALGRWMYTNATVYPWMYAYGSDGGWVFFFEGGRLGSRFFQRGDTGVVVSEDELSL